MANAGDGQKDSRPGFKRPSYLGGMGGPGKITQDKSVSSNEVEPKTGETEHAVEEKEDTQLFTWRVWLMPRRPLVSAVVIGVLILSLAFAYWTFPQIIFILAVALILLNRLAAYLFPVNYILTEKTVGYRTLLARDIRDWARFFTYQEFPDGVLLAHDSRNIRGRMKEGLFLYYDTDNSSKDEILKVVKAKLRPPAEAIQHDSQEKQEKGGFKSALRRVRDLKKKT